jgi:hypothetical protein
MSIAIKQYKTEQENWALKFVQFHVFQFPQNGLTNQQMR